MKFITFGNIKTQYISEYEMIIYDTLKEKKSESQAKNIDNIYPIINKLKYLNTIDDLFAQIYQNGDKSLFCKTISLLINKGILIVVPPFYIIGSDSKKLIFKNLKNITLFAPEEIYIALKLSDKLNQFIECNISIIYKSSRSTIDMVKSKLNFHKYNIVLFEEDNCNINTLPILHSNLILYFQSNDSNSDTYELNKFCVYNNIPYLTIGICDHFSVLGPFFVGKNSLCFECAKKNEVVIALMQFQTYEPYYYRKKRNLFYIDSLINLIIYQIIGFFESGYSSVINSIIYIDEQLNDCYRYDLLKYGDCKKCAIIENYK